MPTASCARGALRSARRYDKKFDPKSADWKKLRVKVRSRERAGGASAACCVTQCWLAANAVAAVAVGGFVAAEWLSRWRNGDEWQELRKICDDEGLDTKGLVEKDEYIKKIKTHFVCQQGPNSRRALPRSQFEPSGSRRDRTSRTKSRVRPGSEGATCWEEVAVRWRLCGERWSCTWMEEGVSRAAPARNGG